MNRRKTSSGRILLVSVAASVFACIDLENTGSRNADAFESQFNVNLKSGQSRDSISFKGMFRDPGWFSIKADGSVLDMNPMRADALTSYGFTVAEPAQMEKSTVTDTRITLGVLDDWVRWTSRQAVSNYIKPGTDLAFLRQAGLGFDSGATSQRLESSIFKTDSIRLSLFAEYARVGSYFAAPDVAIKRQDPFSKPNSTTTRFGAIVERGPVTFTLEQRAQQSLAQENAPTLVQNQIGVWLSFDQLLGRNGGVGEGMSWVVPSAAWFNVGQGKVRAIVSQGVAGDTTSDVSFGLAWNLGKIYMNVGYWKSEYQSQFYPWNGSGLTGSLGFHEGLWGIDLYFDIGSSAQSYGLAGIQQPATQATSGLLFRSRF